jgi:hypothetical protein
MMCVCAFVFVEHCSRMHYISTERVRCEVGGGEVWRCGGV